MLFIIIYLSPIIVFLSSFSILIPDLRLLQVNQKIRKHQLRRKKQIQKILWDNRFRPNQFAQEKLDNYFGREEKEHIQTPENDNMIQLEEVKEEPEVTMGI